MPNHCLRYLGHRRLADLTVDRQSARALFERTKGRNHIFKDAAKTSVSGHAKLKYYKKERSKFSFNIRFLIHFLYQNNNNNSNKVVSLSFTYYKHIKN